MPDDMTTGLRVAELRRLAGLTQEQLAERANLSVKTVQKIEEDGSPSVRLDTLHRLARGLRVTTGELFRRPDQRFVTQVPDAEPVDLFALRRAIEPAPDLPDQPVPLRVLSATLTEVQRLYDTDAYDELAELLPELLVNAELVMQVVQAGGQRQEAARTLVRSLDIAASMAILLHRTDVAERIQFRIQAVAAAVSDPVMAAVGVFSTCWLWMREGRFDEVQRLAAATAEPIEPSLSETDALRATEEWRWPLGKVSQGFDIQARPW